MPLSNHPLTTPRVKLAYLEEINHLPASQNPAKLSREAKKRKKAVIKAITLIIPKPP
jgi:hypothetical protein